MTTLLRLSTETDLATINEIYNEYVLRSTCTYQFEPDTLTDRLAWFQDHPPEQIPGHRR